MNISTSRAGANAGPHRVTGEAAVPPVVRKADLIKHAEGSAQLHSLASMAAAIEQPPPVVVVEQPPVVRFYAARQPHTLV